MIPGRNQEVSRGFGNSGWDPNPCYYRGQGFRVEGWTGWVFEASSAQPRPRNLIWLRTTGLQSAPG